MKVGIDISSLAYGTGVSRYTANVSLSLLAHYPQDIWHFFGTSLRRYHALTAFAAKGKVKTSLFPIPPTVAAKLLVTTGLPVTSLTGPLDVFHAWDWYTPEPGKAALVSTVHDLALFKFPEIAHPKIRSMHEENIRRLKRFNAQIIAVSEATKNDLINYFSYDPTLIHVIPEALPQERLIAGKGKRLTGREPYFLYVGSKEPRKNLENQIEAWRHYKNEYDLIIVSSTGWQNVTRESGLTILSGINDEALSTLYSHASILLYVSLYEGFGIPILEAFHFGVPVVTGNNSGMVEVGDDAVVSVDPSDPEAIREGIALALKNPQQYREKGKSRLKKYSWAQIAQKTYGVYQYALSHK